jgi:hypothetical protein
LKQLINGRPRNSLTVPTSTTSSCGQLSIILGQKKTKRGDDSGISTTLGPIGKVTAAPFSIANLDIQNGSFFGSLTFELDRIKFHIERNSSLSESLPRINLP